jgi:hypothetical protein
MDGVMETEFHLPNTFSTLESAIEKEFKLDARRSTQA